MLTVTRTDPHHWSLTGFVTHELDTALDLILAPWSIDLSHLPWGNQSDETWM